MPRPGQRLFARTLYLLRIPALGAVTGLVLIAVIEEGLGYAARHVMVRWLERQYLAKARIDGLRLRLLSGELWAHGLRVTDPSRPDGSGSLPAVDVGRVRIGWRWGSLLDDGPVVVDRIDIADGTVHVYRRPDGSYSFQRPKAATSRPHRDRPSSRPRRRRAARPVVCRSIRLANVAIRYDDYKHPLPEPMPMFRIRAFAGRNARGSIRIGDRPFEFRVSVGLDGHPDARAACRGSISPSPDGPLLRFTLQAHRLPLPPLRRLFATKLRIEVDAGEVDVEGTAAYGLTDEALWDGRAELCYRHVAFLRIGIRDKRLVGLLPGLRVEHLPKLIPGAEIRRAESGRTYYWVPVQPPAPGATVCLPMRVHEDPEKRQVEQLRWQIDWSRFSLPVPATAPR